MMELENLNTKNEDETFVGFPNKKELKDIFDEIDRDKDGNISVIEMAQAIESKMPNSASFWLLVDELFELGDENKDGVINFEEFCSLAEKISKLTLLQRLLKFPSKSKIKHRLKLYQGCKKWFPKYTAIIIMIHFIMYWCADPTTLEFNPLNKKEWWRYLSYSMIHVSISHLIMNSVFQFTFGGIHELVHGWQMLVIYGCGVAAGSLASAVYAYSSCLRGASTGVYALLTSWITYVILNLWKLPYPMLIIIPISGCIIWILINAIINWHNINNVTHVAHGAGALIGFLIGFAINVLIIWWSKQSDQSVPRWKIYFGVFSAVIFLILLILFIFMNIEDAHM